MNFIQGGPTIPAPFQTSKLGSWTANGDTNAQVFAGTAKYETTFDAPNPQSAIRNPQFFLDLGDVRQSARVKVNGKDYGTLIAPPFRVVVDNLKPTATRSKSKSPASPQTASATSTVAAFSGKFSRTSIS